MPKQFPSYGQHRTSGHAFALEAAPGRHVLEVTYRVRPTTYEEPRHAATYQRILYALGPARSWGGFGVLHVKVLAPAGWPAVFEPALEQTSDVDHSEWVGRFDDIPADWLVTSFSQPNNYSKVESRLFSTSLANFVLLIVGLILLRRRRFWALLTPAAVYATGFLQLQLVEMTANHPDRIAQAYKMSFVEPMIQAKWLLPTLFIYGSVGLWAWSTRKRSKTPD